jgi:hypothetical protein
VFRLLWPGLENSATLGLLSARRCGYCRSQIAWRRRGNQSRLEFFGEGAAGEKHDVAAVGAGCEVQGHLLLFRFGKRLLNKRVQQLGRKMRVRRLLRQ